MVIRKATIYDLVYVLGMYIGLREEVFELTEHDEEALFLELTTLLFNQEEAVFLVAEEDGILKGYISGHITFDDITDTKIGFGKYIYVKESSRDFETRELLTQKFISTFKEAGIKEINFMAVPKTAKFAERLGFEIKATIFKKEVL